MTLKVLYCEKCRRISSLADYPTCVYCGAQKIELVCEENDTPHKMIKLIEEIAECQPVSQPA